MNLSDLSASSPFLASDDFTAGHVFPPLVVESISIQEVPTPGKKEKQPKATMFFVGAKKGWVMNKTEARKIAKEIGETKNIEKTWIGATIVLQVVGDVRRPDGSRGNAFRIQSVTPKQTTSTETAP